MENNTEMYCRCRSSCYIYCTFIVKNGKVRVDCAQAEDKLMCNKWLIRIHSTYGLNELKYKIQYRYNIIILGKVFV